ncbi:hypothetical protein H6763_02025 [Candidatus Nomurabacteria bacterium]|nr:hypothetical protein [Candidatus Nomurabacteria bacterium]
MLIFPIKVTLEDIMDTAKTPPIPSDESNAQKPLEGKEPLPQSIDPVNGSSEMNSTVDPTDANDTNGTIGTTEINNPRSTNTARPTNDTEASIDNDPNIKVSTGKINANDLDHSSEKTSSEIQGTTVQKSNKFISKLLLALTFLILIAVIGILAYWFGTSRDTDDNDGNDQQITEDESPEGIDDDTDITDGEDAEVVDDVVEEDPLPTMLFYIKDYDIYSYDFDTGAEQLLVDNSEDVMNVGRIDVIDIGTIGFGSCETVTDDFGCALYTYDLESGSLNTVRELGPDEFMMEYDFFDPDTYVYVAETTVLTVYYVDGVSVEVADEVTDGEVYGRGGFEDDDQTMRFNNDGTRFYDISTSSLRSSMDFTIYVYDTSDLSRIMIENSTHPEWIDTDRLIYKSGDGLMTIDLRTNEAVSVTPVGQSAFDPYVLQGTEKVLYTVDMSSTSPEVWVLDLSDGSSRRVVEDAVHGVWVSEDLYVYETIEACTEECMASFMTTGVEFSSDPPVSIPEIQSLYNASSYYSY